MAPVLAALMALTGCGKSSEKKTLDDVLALYQESWFREAKAAAVEYMNEPEGKLVYHLCQVFDSTAQDYAGGLKGLKELYDDPDVREKKPLVWAEAGLSYARVIVVNQIRAKAEDRFYLPTEYANMDVKPVFADIRDRCPQTAQGATAVIYLAEAYFASDNKEDHGTAFAMTEKYLSEQKDPAEYTVPAHLYIEKEYINERGDYAKSYEHLKKAYELGIAKDILRRAVLLRMGRTCDSKLNRKSEAKAYYEKYLAEYPFARETPLVKRYLEQMQGK